MSIIQPLEEEKLEYVLEGVVGKRFLNKEDADHLLNLKREAMKLISGIVGSATLGNEDDVDDFFDDEDKE